MNKKYLTLGSHIREELSEIQMSIQRAKKAWSLRNTKTNGHGDTQS